MRKTPLLELKKISLGAWFGAFFDQAKQCVIPVLSILTLSACGSATDKSLSALSTSSHSNAGLASTTGGTVNNSIQTASAPLIYDPATRFSTWGSANPSLKNTPANARTCDPGSADTDQVIGRFKVYANNCVMSYQVSSSHFEQILREGDFFSQELLEQFSQTFKDEFDFIVLSLDTPDAQPPASFNYSGQYQSLGTRLPTRMRRLMGHIQLPFGVDPIINGPFLHEVFHEWGQRGTLPDMGSDEGHWGHVSTQGQLGGFDAGTLLKTGSTTNSAGQVIYHYQAAIHPLQAAPSSPNPSLCTDFTRTYGPSANGGNSVPLGPFELFLMGLVPSTQVAPLIRLNNPVWKSDVFYGPLGPANAKSTVSLVDASGESVIDIDTIRKGLGMADPTLLPKQTDFRAVHVTITTKVSLDPNVIAARRLEASKMALQRHPESNLFRGCVASYNMFTATQGLANIAFGGLREARR